MAKTEQLEQLFESERDHLRAVAYRMLGSTTEADDAVQETWLRLNRSDADSIENLGGWLTTVTARVCLDMLRSRKSRREESIDADLTGPVADSSPEQEALLADSVGVALLVVLDTLTPAERLAFVMHDMFDVSFEEIGSVIGRSPQAARQLASRARRRVRGADKEQHSDLNRERKVVDSFLAALRAGDFEGLLAVLDPDVVLRVDSGALFPDMPKEVHGARAVAGRALEFARAARFGRPALVNGTAGYVVIQGGRPFSVAGFTVAGGRIVAMDVLADAERLRGLDVSVLED